MENVEGRLYEAVQFGQIIERLFVSFAVRFAADSFIHNLCGNERRRSVSTYFTEVVNLIAMKFQSDDLGLISRGRCYCGGEWVINNLNTSLIRSYL